MQTFVSTETRDKFNELAAAAGVTTTELLRHLVEHTVAKGTDPEVSNAITAETKRAEEARQRALQRIVSPKTPTSM
jgi:predicted urease superfamily metal-dependent hydrolase